MELPERQEAAHWVGQDVVDAHGQHVGRCQHVYADDATGLPEWLVAELSDGTRAFVPLTDAESRDGTVRVAFARDKISSAPLFPDSGQLSPDEEARLYEHYGLPYSREASESLLPTAGPSDLAQTGTNTETATETVAAPEPAAPLVTPVAPPAAAAPPTAPAPASTPAPARKGLPVAPEPALLGGLALALAVLAAVRAARGRKSRSSTARTVTKARGTAVKTGRKASRKAKAQARQQAAEAAARREELKRTGAQLTRTAVERSGQLASAGSALATAAAARGKELADSSSGRRQELTATAVARSKELARTTAAARDDVAKAAAARRDELTAAAASRRKDLAKAAAERRKSVESSSRSRRKDAAKAAKARKKSLAKAGKKGRGLVDSGTSAVTGTLGSAAGQAREIGSTVLHAPAQPLRGVRSTSSSAARKARRSWRRTGRRVSLLLGLGAGYVVGARAGRERYDDIVGSAQQLAERPEVQPVVQKVQGLLGQG